jgi:hypothetical protein
MNVLMITQNIKNFIENGEKCGTIINPNIKLCNHCYSLPLNTEMEEWVKEWEEFFPQMCSIYKLHNVPRGVFMDIKSMIKSILSTNSQKLKEKIEELKQDKSKAVQGSQHKFAILGYNNALEDVINIINQVK